MSSDNQYACELISKENLWQELKSAFISSQSLSNGYKLQFSLSPYLLNSIIRIISSERSCCKPLHFRVDVPPSKPDKTDMIELSLLGGRGVKKILEPMLVRMGFKEAENNNSWMKLGITGLVISIACCVLPFIFLALGMAGIAGIFLKLDIIMMLIIFPLSLVFIIWGVYRKRKAGSNCKPGC